MEKQIFYEYVIVKDRIEQHVCEIQGSSWGTYHTKIGRTKRFVNKSDFEKILNRRVYSFDDNYPKYKKMLIDYLETRVDDLSDKLKKEAKLLYELKNQ